MFGVRDKERLVATAALLPYSAGNAWISMVLVAESWRRRGIATRLVDTCLEAAKQQGLTSWLDATPAGANVYGPLGFTPTIQLRRLRLENSAPVASSSAGPLSDCDAGEFAARDRRALGFARDNLLAEFFARPGSRLVSNEDALALVRDGRAARHIGPMFANKPERALALVEAIARSERGPLLIDAVSTQDEFLRGLTSSGWNIERPFQRMRFGRPGAPAAELPFAVAGPEFG
jgi:predicted GNAT family acetyltransferase